MIKHLLFISLSVWCVAALRGVTEALYADKCVPDCTTEPVGTKVEDPVNCTKFYVCLGEDTPPYSMSCPSGQKFDASDPSGCIAEDPTDLCTATCSPTDCHSTCDPDKIVDAITDLKNCSIYYLCSKGNVVGDPGECPADTPYFDGEECSTDDTVCCSDLCYPLCHDGLLDVPDPTDCTKFYRCIVDGPVDPTLHLACDHGSNFDVTVGTCVAGAPCNTLCAGSTIPGEGTTTPSSGCVSSVTCTTVGYFAKCSYCQSQYFHCTQVGEEALVESCTGTLVFNPDPGYPYCISPSDCPHKPLL